MAKEDHPAWPDVKNLKHQDYQVTAGQQDLLATDATWFTADNIATYQTGLKNDEQVATQDAPVFNGQGQDHPPLSSPETGFGSQNEVSQFHTQAPAQLAQSQVKGALEVEDVEETSVEKVLEWDPTPPPETRVPVVAESLPKDDVEPGADEPLDWDESPPPPRQTNMVT